MRHKAPAPDYLIHGIGHGGRRSFLKARDQRVLGRARFLRRLEPKRQESRRQGDEQDGSLTEFHGIASACLSAGSGNGWPRGKILRAGIATMVCLPRSEFNRAEAAHASGVVVGRH
jgi:hypothetical protein